MFFQEKVLDNRFSFAPLQSQKRGSVQNGKTGRKIFKIKSCEERQIVYLCNPLEKEEWKRLGMETSQARKSPG
ncbi:hypothetical protein SAMN05444412_1062 [Rhodonellum ikkaensis]|uniref:Uncharacterized protein n=1 Tax=Rhodonellum ikkaensis TaxID=336829 RepID=A0A1H3QCF5_9BACT|nr:hypothetical protein SAMN05444412_1062 [Rhodonellum ikkaensis]